MSEAHHEVQRLGHGDALSDALAGPGELEHHPHAALFPLMEGPAFKDFCKDVATHGLREPIVTYQGKVLDGRNRLRACVETGTEPTFREVDGIDPLTFVISANLHRRHLDESQRAMVAARLATLPLGANQHAQICAPSQDEAADMLSVSRRSTQFARKVLDSATPELVAAVDRGEVAVSQAAGLVDAPPDYQRAILQKVAAGSPIMFARRLLKQESLKTAAWPDSKHRVIYADPPWRYGNDLARGLTSATAAEDHYPSMSIAELCELRVDSLAMDDSVLFLWVPLPLLEECFDVVRAWGFSYKTAIIWDKVGHHFGHYVSSRCELLLICTRGSCTPDVQDQIDNVVTVEKTRVHSQKPERFREIIDELYPHGPRIELFARQRHEGWDVWGNEVESTRRVDIDRQEAPLSAVEAVDSFVGVGSRA
jgi:N6-adenosine-specific RNA methylase IME4